MSLLGLRSQAFGSCARCLRSESGFAMLRQPFRQATTAAKPRAKKTAGVVPTNDPVVVAKKPLSTRSSATTKPPKKDTKTSRSESLAAAKADKPPKFARAASTSTPAAAKNSSAKPKPATTVSSALKPSPTPRVQETVTAASPEVQAELQPGTRTPIDPKSPEYKQAYKQASRKYTALMVSIPLLLVTSYYLYQRRESPLPEVRLTLDVMANSGPPSCFRPRTQTHPSSRPVTI